MKIKISPYNATNCPGNHRKPRLSQWIIAGSAFACDDCLPNTLRRVGEWDKHNGPFIEHAVQVGEIIVLNQQQLANDIEGLTAAEVAATERSDIRSNLPRWRSIND